MAQKSHTVWSALTAADTGGCALPLTACVTLDLESDYATDEFHALRGVVRLDEICQEAGAPLTVFVEGRVLRDHRDALERFPDSTEFALHCDDHRYLPDTPASLATGVDAFEHALGAQPEGYRAGNYWMTMDLMEALVDHAFRWDASCVTKGRPVCGPFRLANGLWEIPVAVWQPLGVPLTMSVVSLVGRPVFRLLARICPLPGCLSFVVHMHDLVPSSALHSATLIRRIGHSWNYRLGLVDPFCRLSGLLGMLAQQGYRFVTCKELVAGARSRAIRAERGKQQLWQ